MSDSSWIKALHMNKLSESGEEEVDCKERELGWLAHDYVQCCRDHGILETHSRLFAALKASNLIVS